jgi:protein O-GlcNAc transferase
MNTNQLISQAVSAFQAGNFLAAHQLCSTILAGDRKNVVALHLLAVLEAQQKNTKEALKLFDRALKVSPRNADILADKGRLLNEAGKHDEALLCYRAAIAINPKHVPALLNLGCTLLALERSKEALLSFDQLLAVAPDYPLALHNRSIALTDLRRYGEAIAMSDGALAVEPRYAEALQSRAIAHEYLRHHEAAAIDFKAALRLNPELDYLRGQVYWSQLNCCDWQDLTTQKSAIETDLHAGKRVVTPFAFLAISDSMKDQQTCAEIHAASKYPAVLPPLAAGRRYKHERIRLGYLSADFRDHPVAQMLAGMFECHDRSRFEITAFGYGPAEDSPIRRRLATAFEHFVDVDVQDNDRASRLIANREIDILVDLTGYTTHSRPGILASKPAPIQVSYLGFSGTMGASYIDYVIADRSLIQDADRACFTEKVVYLPDSFMGNDSKRAISERAPRRAHNHLPENGFVFCCFNNSYKIHPRMFDIWMRLLGRIDNSVLWLSDTNEAAKSNLRREAQERGVDSGRLIFAPRVALNEDHLARLQLADLFLDTLPYNAHGTTSDALWAGLPVLTCRGASFAGRVAASLLGAAGLSELITESLEDYEALALTLARDPARLASVKAKLARNRGECPLFDTARFTRRIEAAYTIMLERHRRGEPPQSFAVDPID